MNPQAIRSILLFSLVTLASGWIGLWIDQQLPPQPQGDSLGMGIWLVLPLLTATLLSFFQKDRWQSIGFALRWQANKGWYLFALLVFPAVTSIVLLLGHLTGWIQFHSFNGRVLLLSAVNALVLNFVKNIFEEFVWRGYLTTQLLKVKANDVTIYVVVGIVWGAWHLPYYLHFFPEEGLQQVLPVSRLAFALWAIVSMMGWSILFVELYRITRSIWSVVVLHTIEDATVNHLVLDQHITITTGKEIFISPIVGVITTLLYIGVGLWLRGRRRFLLGNP